MDSKKLLREKKNIINNRKINRYPNSVPPFDDRCGQKIIIVNIYNVSTDDFLPTFVIEIVTVI